MALIPSELTNKFITFTSIDKALDHLLQLNYPPEKAYLYTKDLREIRQGDYHSIKEYQSAIENVIKKLSICKGWGKSAQAEREEEQFLEGLTDLTRKEIIKRTLNKRKEIFDYIDNVEDSAIKYFSEKASNTKLDKDVNQLTKRKLTINLLNGAKDIVLLTMTTKNVLPRKIT